MTFDPLECTEVTRRFDFASVATEGQACQHLRRSVEDKPIEYFTQSVDKHCFVTPYKNLKAEAGQPPQSQEILVGKAGVEQLLRGNPDKRQGIEFKSTCCMAHANLRGTVGVHLVRERHRAPKHAITFMNGAEMKLESPLRHSNTERFLSLLGILDKLSFVYKYICALLQLMCTGAA